MRHASFSAILVALALCGCEGAAVPRVDTATPPSSPPGGPGGTSTFSGSGGAHDTAGPRSDTASTPSTDPEHVMYGFSFVEPQLAGMPLPYGDDFGFLARESVDLLVGLRLSAVDEADLAPHGIDYLHLPIEDFHPPTLQQQQTFVEVVQARIDAGDVVGVHCTAGVGRTGTMLATWFVHRGMTPRDAIDHVRALRPGSIETDEQEASVVHYATTLR